MRNRVSRVIGALVPGSLTPTASNSAILPWRATRSTAPGIVPFSESARSICVMRFSRSDDRPTCAGSALGNSSARARVETSTNAKAIAKARMSIPRIVEADCRRCSTDQLWNGMNGSILLGWREPMGGARTEAASNAQRGVLTDSLLVKRTNLVRDPVRIFLQVAWRDRDEGDNQVVRLGNADLRHEGMRRAGRVVEMAAANHGLQHRLAVPVEGEALRLAHDIHRELIGAAGDVRVKLDFRQEYRRDAATVPVLAQTPRAGSAEIRRGGQAMLGAGQDGAQGFLGVEFRAGRGARLAE